MRAGAPTRHGKRAARLIVGLGLGLILLVAAVGTQGGGSSASAAAICQVLANGTVTGQGTGGGAGSLSPLQVEQLWVSAGGPPSGAVTAAALASAESDDIADRIQGSSTSTPTVPTASTPADPLLVGYGLWQITPGSPADYNPTENARLAVQKYEGSLTTGGGGWSPWTTYGTLAYQQALPAAQAAFTQLQSTGGGGVAATPVSTTPPPTAHTPPDTNHTAPPEFDTTAAVQYITRLDGAADAQFAITGPNGRLLASHHAQALIPVGSTARVLLLIAYLHTHPQAPAGQAAQTLEAAYRKPESPAGQWAAHQAGAATLTGLSAITGLPSLRVDAADLEDSQITVKDLASLAANLDELIPAGARSWAAGLLADTSTGGWGLKQPALTAVGPVVSGSFQQAERSFTVLQAGQDKDPSSGTLGVAITTTSANSISGGQNTVTNLATDLLGTPTADDLGYGIDLSSLTAAQQTEIYNAASSMSASPDAPCPNVSVSAITPTVPGQAATINTQTGVASAPTGLPTNVKTVIARLIGAGNDIHALPYIWGGGHQQPLSEISGGYDCSGAVSYMLYQAGLLHSPDAIVSYDYNSWGDPGPGKYVTVFSDTSENPGHVLIDVDGILMDTAHFTPTAPAGSGPRWQTSAALQPQLNAGDGSGTGHWVETHPPGL